MVFLGRSAGRKSTFVAACVATATLLCIVWMHSTTAGREKATGQFFGWNFSRYSLRNSSAERAPEINCKLRIQPDENELYIRRLALEYSAFHSQARAKLVRGEKVKTLIYMCPKVHCGGLGVRTRGMILMWLLAMITNRVALFRWEAEITYEQFLEPAYFDWSFPPQNITANNSFTYFSNFYGVDVEVKKSKLVKALADDIDIIQGNFNFLQLFNSLFSKVAKSVPYANNTLIDSLQQYDLKMLEDYSVPCLFKFSHKLKVFSDQVREQTKLPDHYIALHIRAGIVRPGIMPVLGSEEWPKRFDEGVADLNCAVNCAIKHANQVGSNTPIVVLADREEIKQEVVKKHPRLRAYASESFNEDYEGAVTSDLMMGTWQDMILLAEADLVLLHGSAFPLFAITMCRTKHIDYLSCE